MKVLQPVAVTEAVLVASDIAEPDAGEMLWVSGTTYSVGDVRARAETHRLYERLVAGAGTTPPENDATNWKDVGPTNRWAMFDQEVNTQSQRASSLTVTLAPGVCNALALLELVGQSTQITVRDGAAGPVVYSRTVELDVSVVTDWYAYFFEPFTQRASVVLDDLPPYLSAHIEVEISSSGTAKAGQCIVGTLYPLGATELGVTAGIRDYSRKTTDEETGVVSLERRKFRKTIQARFRLATAAASAVSQRLTGLRATPVVWLADEGTGLEPLIAFGFYRDFKLQVAFPTVSFYDLEIEGMT